jgi:hypothetical protein
MFSYLSNVYNYGSRPRCYLNYHDKKYLGPNLIEHQWLFYNIGIIDLVRHLLENGRGAISIGHCHSRDPGIFLKSQAAYIPVMGISE